MNKLLNKARRLREEADAIEEEAMIKRRKRLPKKYTVGSDPNWALQEWANFIAEQIVKYGPRSILSTDAGANNVDLEVEVHS
jgi:hypothetical protein